MCPLTNGQDGWTERSPNGQFEDRSTERATEQATTSGATDESLSLSLDAAILVTFVARLLFISALA